MLHLILSFFQISLLIPLEWLLVLQLLLHFDHLWVEFPNDILLLLLPQLLYFWVDSRHWRQKLLFQLFDHRFVLLLDLFSFVFFIFILVFFFWRISVILCDSELCLKLFDILPVVHLPHDVPVLPPENVVLNFLILLHDLLHLYLDVRVPSQPVCVLNLRVRVSDVFVSFTSNYLSYRKFIVWVMYF